MATTIPFPATAAFEGLWASFERALRAENRSPKTLRTYSAARLSLERWLLAAGRPVDPLSVTKADLESWMGELVTTAAPATASVYFAAIRRFYNWLVDEGELERSPMARMRAPAIPEKPIDMLDPQQLAALLRACEGREFVDRRDLALFRVMVDTGLRRSEAVNLHLDDVDLDGQLIRVRRGKGGTAALVPIGLKSVRDLDRYLRGRARHLHHERPELWLTQRGALSSDGLNWVLRRRARAAGIEGAHLHQLRHAFADSWKRAGGSEESLQRLGRWKSRAMLQRYGAHFAGQRAREEHGRLSPGDRL